MTERRTRSQGDGLKGRFDAFRVRAAELTNLRQFYKWSIAAGLVGVVAGIGTIGFNAALNLSVGWFGWLRTALPALWLLPLIPALGGVLVGIIRQSWMPEAFASPCATDTMIDIIHQDDGRAKIRVPFATIVTAAITLGSGGSAGRECPTALIGTGFGSLVAQIIERLGLDRRLGFKLSRDDMRTLAICGAAAGLGAIFRAPIGGALFAVSVLYIYGMEFDHFLPAVISSLTAYVVFSSVYGFEPMFSAPFTWQINPFDIGVVLVIGVVGSLVGVLWIKVFYGVFNRFRAIKMPNFLKPAAGGLILGLLVLVVPQVWGMGYATIQQAIDYKIGLGVLIVLIFAKMLASAFSIGSGGAGGVIAPSLFIGAALGGTIGDIAVRIFPHAGVHPALFVIAGMGAVYASVGKVPLAITVLLCEATRNYSMIIPLAIASTAAYLASGSTTIYESQRLSAAQDQADVLRRTPIRDVVRGDPATVGADASVSDLMELVSSSYHHGFPVVEDERLVGVVSWKDVNRIPLEVRGTTTVREIMTSPVVSLRASDTARAALDLLDARGVGRIVIVDDDDPGHVVGVLTKADLVHAYAAALEDDSRLLQL
jgi:CIC family chloride channel protein